MKLSKRIQDLLRANLASPPRWFSGRGKARSPAQMEAQLEQIRKSLAQAAGREKRLQDELALAEQEGREREAIRLRRELAELGRSRDELQAALDVIEARIEMARQSQTAAVAIPSTAKELASPQPSLAESGEDAELAARKSRLAAPEEKPGTTTAKPHQIQRGRS